MATYREILKWGDKRETSLDDGMKKLVKEKFNLSDTDLANKYLAGFEEVKIEAKNQISDEIINKFNEISGKENVSKAVEEIAMHSFGKHYEELLKLRLNIIDNPPDLVIYPRTSEEVEQIVKLCNKEKIAIVPFGAGSSVTGALQMPKGGVSLDLTKHLNKVIKINEKNHSATVQAGMYGPAFEKELNAYKIAFTCGHFPQSFEFSTVGGWVAARGAGTFSTGYGKIEDMLLSMKVITPAGVIETKDYPADAEAWDLNHTFIGSEGTLGVITEVTMQIRKHRPESRAYAAFIYKTFEDAVNAMQESMQAGYGKPHLYRISDPEETDVAFKIKNFDGTFADKFLKFRGYKSKSRTLMFTAIDGDADYTSFVKKKIKKTAKKHSGMYIGASATKKWLEQKYSSAYNREPMMDLGIITDTIETAVSWDNLHGLWSNVRSYLDSRAGTTTMIHISHVYENGANLYITFLSPMKQGDEINDYIELHKGLVDTIISNKGSISHHHGVGRYLSKWMKQEKGKTEIALMQASKNHLDPNGIMNPGDMLGLA